jgi:hypothetical protein
MKKYFIFSLAVAVLCITLSGCTIQNRYVMADGREQIVTTDLTPVVVLGTAAVLAATGTNVGVYYNTYGTYYNPYTYAPPFWPAYPITQWYYQPGYVVFIGRDGQHHHHPYNFQRPAMKKHLKHR